MDAARPPRRRRRPRRRTADRPLDTRLVRVASLVLVPAVLLALVTVSAPGVLPPPAVEPAFDGTSAAALSAELSAAYPARVPGTPEAELAASWYVQTMASLGLPTEEQVWRENVPGLGDVGLRNVVTIVRGRSPSAIVVAAYRDNQGARTPSDNASGTAALIELARPFGTLGDVRPPVPQRTLVLVSTDGGSWGGAGAVRFVERSPYADDVVAVVILDRPDRPASPRLGLAAGAVAAPARALVSTAAARIEEYAGARVDLPSPLTQLVELGVPYAAGEQGPFLARGISAVTISTDAPRSGVPGGPQLRRETLGALGRACEALVGSLDATARRTFGTPDAIFVEDRVLSGWAARLLFVAAVAPFAVGVVDLVTRSRRRAVAFRPALRSLRSRLLLWLYGGVLIWVGALLGVLPTGSALPYPPTEVDGGSAPGVILLALAFGLGWALARRRLAPQGGASQADMLAGYAVGLAWLGAVAVVVAIVRPYALVFLLPSLYAWLWLPLQARRPARLALFMLGLAGPIVGLLVLADALEIGPFATARYVIGLVTVGYVPIGSVLLAVGWVAAAAQLGALALGRYGPYAGGYEPPPPGLVRTSVGRLGRRAIHRGSPQTSGR